MTSARLRRITQDLHVWQPLTSGWGLANCGLLLSGNGTGAWIDCPYDTRLGSEFRALSSALGADMINWLVVTHGNGDHHWGAGVIPDAAIIYTHETTSHIAHEPDPAALHAMAHEASDPDVVSWYVNQHFSRFDWRDAEVRAPTITFSGDLQLRLGHSVVDLIQLRPAHTAGDLIAYFPQQRVCFAGDIVFGTSNEHPGDTPVHWSGPLASVIEGCERVLATGATTIVPGHGPLLDREGVQAHIRYLDGLRAASHALHAHGATSLDAARQIIRSGQIAAVGLPERLAVTLAAEWAHLNGAPTPTMAEQILALATLAWELAGPAPIVPQPRPEAAPAAVIRP